MAEAIIIDNPLKLSVRKRVPVAPGLTVAEVCELAEVRAAINEHEMIVSRGGGVIDPARYGLIRVDERDVFLFVPGTADDQTAAVVGMLALTAIAPGVGNLLVGHAWAAEATFLSTVAAGAVVVGGGLLINSMGRKPPKLTPTLDNADEKSNSYGWTPATVQRAGLKRPRVYGEIKVTGVLVQTAWAFSTSTQLTFYGVVLLGHGPFDEPVVPGTVKICGQKIDNYGANAIGIRTRHGDIDQSPFRYARGQWYQYRPFIKVTNAGGPVEFDTYGTIFDRVTILLSFPTGLYDGTGASPASLTVNVTIKIRKSNSTVWQTIVDNGAITETETGPVYRQYDTSDYVGDQDRYLRHTIQVTRETADRSGLYFDELYVDLVRETLNEPMERPGQGLAEIIGLNASDYLTGPFSFECVSRGRPVRIYDDGSQTWSIAWADRLAWILYDCFTQPVLTGKRSAWKDLECLLHFEGDNNATSTYDSAPYGHVITFSGNAKIDTTNPKFGSSRLNLDGTGDFITLAKCGGDLCHDEYNGDWTLDVFVNFDTHAAAAEYVCSCEFDTNNRWGLYHSHGNGFVFHLVVGGVTVINTGFGGEITDTAWHHVALVKKTSGSGAVYGVYVDGTQVNYTADNTRTDLLSADLHLGKGGAGNYFDGSLDEFRLIRRNIFGADPVSGLTDTITPPVAAYSDPGNTYADGGHECYADSQMDLDAFVEADEWCDAPRVNTDRIYIDAITQATEAIVTTRSASNLKPGDKILFRNVSQNGMVELVDGTTAIVLSQIDSVTLRVDLDTSAYSAYESLNKLLYQFEEPDGSDYTSDRSAQGHDAGTADFKGGAQVSTAAYKWGGGSLLLDGSGDYIQLADDPDWDVVASAADSWTIDIQVKFDVHAGTETIISQFEDANNYWSLQHVHGSGFRFIVQSGGATIITTGYGGEITDTSWHHVALVKVADEYGIYVDGSQVVYVQDSSTDTFAGTLNIGSLAGTSDFDGYLDEVRINKGNPFEAAPVVGLTDTITEPTAAYASQDFDDIELLCHFDGVDAATTSSDSSDNAHALTFNGAAQLDTAQYKFGISSLLIAAAADYVTIPDAASWDVIGSTADDRTVDLWVRLNDHTGFSTICAHYQDTNNYWYLWHVHGSGIWFVGKVGGVYVIQLQSGGEITDTSWHHIAICKVANEIGIYLDGAQVQYGTLSAAGTFSGAFVLGQLYAGYTVRHYDGWIDEVRVTSDNFFGAAPVVGLTDTIEAPLAEFADPDLTGTLEKYLPRFSYNDIVDDATGGSVWDTASRICRLARLTPTWRGARVSLTINKAKSASYTFTMGNIIAGSYKRTLIRSAERSSRLTAHYKDATEYHERTPIRVDSATLQATSANSRSRVDAFGLAHRAQVEDVLTFMLREGEYIHWKCEIGAAIDALGVELGDVVNFQHDAANYGLIGSRDAHYTGGGRIISAENNTLSLSDVDASGLAGHWGFDEIAGTAVADSSGNGNTGTLTGGSDAADITVNGRWSGGAFRLDGVADYVDCNSSFESVIQGSWTFTIFARPTDGQPSAVQWIFGTQTSSTDYIVVALQANGSIKAWYASNGNATTATSAAGVFENGRTKWRFIAVTMDATVEGAGGLRLYVDGTQVASGSTAGITSGDYSNTNDLFCGSRNLSGSPDTRFAGDVDEFRLYSRVLTGPELLTVMYGGPRARIVIAGSLAFADPDFEGGSTRYNMLIKSQADVESIVPIIGYDPAAREVSVLGPLADLPEPGSVWAAGVENLQTKQFRVTNGRVDELMHPFIELTEYAPECYAGD